ncbi:MAG: hypothetical protein J5605_08590 [Bacteroidales bacterium]|nr:hypothetical protein [Bacteroidales bacterium]
MNLDISQDNLYLLLPSKVSHISEMLSDDNNTDIVTAIKQVYSSPLYKRLEQEETITWHLGPVALYQDFWGEVQTV